MKTTRNHIENLIAEICKVTGTKNNRTDAIKAGQSEFMSYSGNNGLYSLHMIDVNTGSISRVFDTPYTKQVFKIDELQAHLTGILAGLNAFMEAYKQTIS